VLPEADPNVLELLKQVLVHPLLRAQKPANERSGLTQAVGNLASKMVAALAGVGDERKKRNKAVVVNTVRRTDACDAVMVFVCST